MPNMLNNNFGMGMNNNFMPNMMNNNNNFFMPNMMMNNNFNFMPNMMINNNNFNPNLEEKIICVSFKTTNGRTYNINVNYGTTVGQLIEIFFMKIEKPELYAEKSDRFDFMYNVCKIRYDDQTPVEEFFKHEHPTIMVNDISIHGG